MVPEWTAEAPGITGADIEPKPTGPQGARMLDRLCGVGRHGSNADGSWGRPNFQVHFAKSQVAASLWDYGED